MFKRLSLQYRFHHGPVEKLEIFKFQHITCISAREDEVKATESREDGGTGKGWSSYRRRRYSQ